MSWSRIPVRRKPSSSTPAVSSKRAAEESIDTILQAASLQKRGALPARSSWPGVCPNATGIPSGRPCRKSIFFLGTGAYDRVIEAIEARPIASATACLLPDPDALAPQTAATPRTLAGGPMAYLKITEGCDRHCTFCIIPKLRGRPEKPPPDGYPAGSPHPGPGPGSKSWFSWGRKPPAMGTINLRGVPPWPTSWRNSADSRTRSGSALCTATRKVWMRRSYKTVASHPNLCSYFDIPIQHVSSELLRAHGPPL